jgi:hypothetical protein
MERANVTFAVVLVSFSVASNSATAEPQCDRGFSWSPTYNRCISDYPLITPGPRGPTCEWNPVDEYLPAGVECGFNDIGLPVAGVFSCGKTLSCERRCDFKQCREP